MDQETTEAAVQSQLTSHDAIQRFILAGDATFTLVSKQTRTRFTYKLSRSADNDSLYFVKLLTGPDNWNNYQFLGSLRTDNKTYTHSKKSKISVESMGAVAINWFLQMFLSKKTWHILQQTEIWHEGKCGRCGRKLTVPESIANGIGPECMSKMGG